MKMIKISYEDTHEHTGKLYNAISAKEFPCVVLVAMVRGGWLTARILAAHFEEAGVSCFSYNVAASYIDHRTPNEKAILKQKLDEESVDQIRQLISNGAKVIVVDSVCQTGREMIAIQDYLASLFGKESVFTAAMHMVQFNNCPSAPWRKICHKPDFIGVSFKYDEMPYIDYPWEYSSLEKFTSRRKIC